MPPIDDLLLNPASAAAVVVVLVNVISYAAGVKPNWLAVVVGLAYMIGGYIATGRTAPDQLFLATVYALLIVAPLAHVDSAVLSRLFGAESSKQTMRVVGETDRSSFWQNWL